MNIVIQNGFILPMNRKEGDTLYFKGHLIIEGNKIASITTNISDVEAYCRNNQVRLIDASNKIVMPGLINTHTHVAMTLMRGYADDMSLMEWLNTKIWPFESMLTGEDAYWGSMLGVAEMLLGGTTSFVDMYFFIQDVHRAVKKQGIRAMLSAVVFDSSINSFENELEKTWNNWDDNDQRLSLCLGPHAPYTCNPQTLQTLVRLAKKNNLPIHIHLAETKDEIYQINQRYQVTPTQYLYEHGVFENRTLAAHCIYLNDKDIDLLKQNNVSILHNPHSNMKLASGIAHISKYLSKEINVSIGTDGASSNNNLCMWEEMRSASLLQKVSTLDPCILNAYQTLQLATVNGAKTMGMENKLGILEEGALADVILIDLNKPHLYPQFDPITHLVYSARNEDVNTVIVDGKILVDNRKLLTANLDEVCNEVEMRAKRIAAKVSKK